MQVVTPCMLRSHTGVLQDHVPAVPALAVFALVSIRPACHVAATHPWSFAGNGALLVRSSPALDGEDDVLLEVAAGTAVRALAGLERPESAALPSITVVLQCSPVHAFGLQPSGCINPSCITNVCGVAQVILSDGVLHSSQANASLRSRRAWMPQFSCRPIRWQATCAPVALAIPIGPSDQEPDTVHCVTP